MLLGLFPLMILSFTIGVALLIAIYLQNNDYSSAKIGEKYWTEERIERLAGLAKKLASISMILSYSIVALVAIAFLLASFLGISSFIFGAIVIGLGSLAVLAWMAVTSTSAGIAIETYNRSENSKKAGRSLLMQILINTLLYLVSFIVGLVLLFALSI